MKKTEEELLKNHVCLQPFRHIELLKTNASLCCPTWLRKPLTYKRNEEGEFDYDVWNSDSAQEIRKSILDGSYKYCDKKLCPHLNTLLSTGVNNGMFARVDKPTKEEVIWGDGQTFFPFSDEDGIEIHNEANLKTGPGSINFTFDRSCNLRCPSCRLETIMEKPDEVREIDKIIDFINSGYSRDCRRIVITGSGDPFASKSFRRFMFNFDPNQWPKLKTVYLVTNGKLFNKKNWDMMKNIQPYITEVEVSIDAGTKDTYENKTRVGGHWETLVENLKFMMEATGYLAGETLGGFIDAFNDVDFADSEKREQFWTKVAPTVSRMIQRKFAQNNIQISYKIAETSSYLAWFRR